MKKCGKRKQTLNEITKNLDEHFCGRPKDHKGKHKCSGYRQNFEWEGCGLSWKNLTQKGKS